MKNKRAAWVSVDTIRMIRQSQEEVIVEAFEMESAAPYAGNGFTKASALDDKAILDLAKRRLSVKRSLVSQVIDFVFICITLFILIASFDGDTRLIVSLIFCTIWGIRLLLRIFKFAKPSFKGGVASFLRERQKQKLESEYNRLRKMNTEYMVDEFN